MHTIKLLAKDYFLYNSALRELLSRGLRWHEILSRPVDSNSTAWLVDRLAHAARLTTSERQQVIIEQRLGELMSQWTSSGFDWDRFFPLSSKRLVQKAIILKPALPNGERGVLFVAFEDNWLRLLRYANVSKLAGYYDLVLSPTWSPPQDLPMLVAARMWPRAMYSILSHIDDEVIFHRLSENLRPIPLLASSWVNPNIFQSRSVPKRYDIVMLANFGEYKRHFALFRALGGAPLKLSVLLLGGRWGGRTPEVLLTEAAHFGVRDQITIEENLPDVDMIPALQSARVSVIMSKGEGSCVAVAESLFANIPVGLIEGARVGSNVFINAQTGRFLRESRLGEDLVDFVNHYSDFQPRQWMLDGATSCYASSQILNQLLRQHAESEGRPWTQDLKPMQWRPNAEYLNAEDAAALHSPR